MAFYPVSSTVGVDLNNASSSNNFALGTRVDGTNDSLFVYVVANGAMTTGMCVAITPTGTAKPCIGTDAAVVTNELGFVQTSAADGQYVWAARNGYGMYVAVSGSALVNTIMYPSAAASGLLCQTANIGTLTGIQMANASGTAAIIVGTANLTWPKCASVGF